MLSLSMPNYANLDNQLRPIDAPILSGSLSTPMDFNSEVDRNTVNNYSLGAISAGKITAGTISGTVIYGGTITGNQLAGGTLTLGGTVNGNGVMQIKNSSGTVIVQGDNAGHHYYGTSGIENTRVDSSGLHIYGTSTSLADYSSSAGGTVYGRLGFQSGTQSFWLESLNGNSMYLSSGSNTYIVPAGIMYALPASFYITADTNGTVQTSGSLNLFSTNNDVNIDAGDDVQLSAIDDIRLTYGGDFVLNGATKTAIVRTKDEYRALYAVEAPNVWFMDFCPAIGAVDPMFKEVTEEPYHYIKCVDNCYQVWGRRKGLGTVRFEKKTAADFYVNNMLYSGQFIKDELKKKFNKDKIN